MPRVEGKGNQAPERGFDQCNRLLPCQHLLITSSWHSECELIHHVLVVWSKHAPLPLNSTPVLWGRSLSAARFVNAVFSKLPLGLSGHGLLSSRAVVRPVNCISALCWTSLCRGMLWSRSCCGNAGGAGEGAPYAHTCWCWHSVESKEHKCTEDRLLSLHDGRSLSMINLPRGGWLDLRKPAYGAQRSSPAVRRQHAAAAVPSACACLGAGTALTPATVAIAHGHFKQALGWLGKEAHGHPRNVSFESAPVGEALWWHRVGRSLYHPSEGRGSQAVQVAKSHMSCLDRRAQHTNQPNGLDPVEFLFGRRGSSPWTLL